MFVIDTTNAFSTNSELLQDVSQFNIQCRNMLLSANTKYATQPAIASFNAQLVEEIDCYKSYDV
mgnify:CR=1 FL=1